MSPASSAELVSSLFALTKDGPEALARIEAWLKNEGEKPEGDLAKLPDLTRNHLELAALELRAKAAGG